ATAAAAAGFPTDLTVVSIPDTTPPTLTAFDFNPKTISTGGATLNVSFTVADPGTNASGATNFAIAFLSPSGAQSFSGSATFAPSASFTGSLLVVLHPGI